MAYRLGLKELQPRFTDNFSISLCYIEVEPEDENTIIEYIEDLKIEGYILLRTLNILMLLKKLGLLDIGFYGLKCL